MAEVVATTRWRDVTAPTSRSDFNESACHQCTDTTQLRVTLPIIITITALKPFRYGSVKDVSLVQGGWVREEVMEMDERRSDGDGWRTSRMSLQDVSHHSPEGSFYDWSF